MSARFARTLLLIAPLAVLACINGPVERGGRSVPYEEAAASDLSRARELLARGQLEPARELLEGFLRDLARSHQTHEALWLLGDVYERLDRREDAARTWSRLVRAFPDSPHNAPAALRAAAIYRRMGRSQDARQILERAAWERASDPVRVRGQRLRAALASEAGDHVEALVALALARRDAAEPEVVAALDASIQDAIQLRLSEAELQRALSDLPRGPVYDRANLALARHALSRSDPGAARAALDRLPRALQPDEELERQLLEERARGGGAPVAGTIGLALPLSGPYARFGESALHAIALALGVYGEDEAQIRVLVRDTRGEVERAAAIVSELAQAGAAAIIGPLRSAEAAAAAPAAESAGIPLLTLARREDLARLGDFVLRIGPSPSEEARALVDHFAGARGMRRFAVLYPDDDFGRDFKNVFWERVETAGGEIVGVERYAPDAVDLQQPIRKLVGLQFLTGEEQRLIALRERLRRKPAENAARLAQSDLQALPPYVDFDALFIPDAAAKAGLILPQLRFFDVRGIAFLGPSEWNDPKLLEIAGAQAGGAVFATAFWPQGDDPRVRDFATRYRDAHGGDPDLLAALAHDAAALLRQVLEHSGARSREELRRALLDTHELAAGVSGLTGFDADGASLHELRLLAVERGSVRPLGDLPQSSSALR
jgi:ABC-type branched-subunit amino acid transport system substrate-binding protein